MKEKRKWYKKKKFLIPMGLFVAFILIGIIAGPSEEQSEVSGETSKVEQSVKELEEKEPELTPEEQAVAVHQKWIESQFSEWDSSHRNLVKLVKESMNDPKSFEHVETKYLIIERQDQIDKMGRGAIGDLFIYMKFRGANAFGGIILSEVSAIAEYETNTIIILSE